MEKRRCPRKKAGFGPAGRETLRLTGRMAAALTRLNSGQLFHAARMAPADGNGSFRTYLLDAICTMSADRLMAGAKIEEL